jgi:hypothetical protein
MATRSILYPVWWRRAGSLMICVFLLGIIMPAARPAAADQAVGWSEPIALSPDTQSSWFPDIAADASGQVHVVWATSLATGVAEAYDVVMYATSQDGITWTSPNDIVALPSKGAVTRPSLWADNQGILHITFKSYTVYYSNAPVRSVSPESMRAPVPISSPNNNNNGYFSRLAIDQQGRLHLVYTENIQSPSCVGCFHIFYRQSNDDGLTWTPAVDISNQANGAAKPQLVIDEAGNLHVAWEAGKGGDLGQLDPSFPTSVYYTGSNDGGQSWSSPIALASFPNVVPTAVPATNTPSPTQPRASPTASPAAPTPSPTAFPNSFKNIALGLDGKGNVVVAWLALPEDRVYYQVSADQGHSWSDPHNIPGVWGAWTLYQGRTDDYAMTTDSSGVVHLVLVGRTAEKQDALSVIHVTWNGFAWGVPDAITTMTGDVPEWPRAAVGLGDNLHVVWFVRDQAHIFDSGGATQYRVWYSHMLLSAPALTPVVWPTLSPTVQPSAVPAIATVVAGPSLQPTAQIASTPSPATNTQLVYNEMDYLKVVVTGLIPAVLVIILIMGAVLLMRR